jgi:hypothetical protein
MKLLFTKTFAARSTRRQGDLPGNPVVIEVFENGGRRWIKGLRLAPMLGISTSSLRQALRTYPELQDDRHNQLASLEGESGGPLRMLTIEGARLVANRSQVRRRFAVKAFLDEIEKLQ